MILLLRLLSLRKAATVILTFHSTTKELLIGLKYSDIKAQSVSKNLLHPDLFPQN